MNPILQKLNPGNQPQQGGLLRRLMSGGKPNQLYQELMNSNEQFRNFVNENQGKSPEEIARAYGVDINPILGMIKK